jgi:lipopolysaccharide/colanic/teichoic acid biosynthesis glycosyltransferase
MSMTLDASQEHDFGLVGPRPAAREATLLAAPERPSPLRARSRGWQAVKSLVEFGLAAMLLLLTGPIILLCAVLIKLTSRGPAFYSQTRVGLGGRPYQICKLRTMYHMCEAKSGPQWSQRGDPRVTRLGRFLRATHLDELPQLWNILKGEMSLVGPRPERPEFIPGLASAVPLYKMRLLVRPGVTGLAQVQLPPDTDVNSVRAKIAYDLHYVRQASLWLDLRILFATVIKVFGGSFGLLCRLFRFPDRSVIEEGYQALVRTGPPDGAPARLEPSANPVG